MKRFAIMESFGSDGCKVFINGIIFYLRRHGEEEFVHHVFRYRPAGEMYERVGS